VRVVGVSVDPLTTLQRFRDKYSLGFPLVSDKKRTLGESYGTLKGGVTSSNERDTLVLARDSTVLLAYQRVSAKGHAAKVLADVKKLREEGGL
jgi:peroxiredoxin Q/BCP